MGTVKKKDPMTRERKARMIEARMIEARMIEAMKNG
jgi:hypothetical protein